MGTYDSYIADVACPSCGDIYTIEGETDFFMPFGGSQNFRVGLPKRAHDLVPSELDSLAFSASRWRVRVPSDDSMRFTLLVDFEAMFACGCELPFAPLLHFEIGNGTVTLERIELLDARTNIADKVDFADAKPLWTGDQQSTDARVSNLGAAPFSARAALLRELIDNRFYVPEDGQVIAGMTPMVGPTRCEACGDVRERSEWTSLAQSFFGSTWTGGVLFLGSRVAFEDHWLDEDVDLSWLFRARHPIGNTIAVLGRRRSYGCGCGAGLARVLARFRRLTGELELADLSLRVVKGPAELADVDFIEGTSRIGPRPDLPPRTRAQVLAEIR